MTKPTKEECLMILYNLKEEMEFWEWDEDYYESGYRSREARIDWAMDRMDAIIETIKKEFKEDA